MKKILQNNEGVALVTVILIIAILGILAAVAIETTGTDILNAGNYTSTEQILNVSNSAMNIVFSQLTTNQDTNQGIGLPAANVYYYTEADGLHQANCTPSSGNDYCASYLALTPANIDPNFSNAGVLGFTPPAGVGFGFEYEGSYGSYPGFSLNYKFYNGELNAITQNSNTGKTVQTGMTFSYGPVKVGYGY